MKTGKYYFSLLSDDEQEKFKANTIAEESEEYFNQTIIKTFYSFSTFVGTFFIWFESPEDHDYWNDIAKRNID